MMQPQQRRALLSYAGIPAVMLAVWLARRGSVEPARLLLWEVLVIFAYLAARSDLLEKRVSNRLILWMLGAWAVLLVPQLFLRTETALALMAGGGLGLALGGGLFLTVYLLSRGGLGGGDVKLMAAAGLYLGWQCVLPAMLYGSVLAALAGGVLILRKKIGRKDAIPLVPFLYAGMVLTMLSR